MPRLKKQSAGQKRLKKKLANKRQRLIAKNGIESDAPTKVKRPLPVRVEDWSPEAQEMIRDLEERSLREFLEFVGLATDGRKQKLISRIIHLRSKTEQRVKDKLEELHRRSAGARNAKGNGEKKDNENPRRKKEVEERMELRPKRKVELRPKKKRRLVRFDETDDSEDERLERAKRQKEDRMLRRQERASANSTAPSTKRSSRVKQSQEERTRLRTHVSEGCSTGLVYACNSNGGSDTHIPTSRVTLFRLTYNSLPPADASTTVESSSGGLPNTSHRPNRTPESSSCPTEKSHSTPTKTDCVKMKVLPFFDVLEIIQDVTTLVRKSGRKGNTAEIPFNLSPHQAEIIGRSRTVTLLRNGSWAVNFGVKVLLRFALLDTSVEQDDELPLNMSLSINGKPAPLPEALPRRRIADDIRRPGRPIHITSLLNLSPDQPNTITVSWSGARILPYVWSLWLVRVNTSDVLLERLKNARIPPSVTHLSVVNKLRGDGDSELTVSSSLRVSLLCPISRQRMRCAVKKASGCDHVQCWDALTFLRMNEKKPTWRCPVCNTEAQFKHLAVDGLIQEILDRTASDVAEVEFLRDGSWKPLNDTPQLFYSSLISRASGSPACDDLRSQQTVLEGNDYVVNLADDDDDDDSAL